MAASADARADAVEAQADVTATQLENQADAAKRAKTLTEEQEDELLEDYGEELLGYTYLEYENEVDSEG